MGRFYGRRIEACGDTERYYSSLTLSSGPAIEVEVSKEVFDALDDLQRDFWRIERAESRHALHLEMMNTADLQSVCCEEEDPQYLSIKRFESYRVVQAVLSLPKKQRRRLLLHAFEGLSISEIAFIEGCSERAVKYSLALARKNLKEILTE